MLDKRLFRVSLYSILAFAGFGLPIGTGCGGSSGTPPPPRTVATPAISPAGGSYPSAQTVTLTEATASATIYYTIDGSAPTSSSTRYTTPFTVSTNTTVNAIGVETGYASSTVAAAIYKITAPTAATPQFSPAPGSYVSTETVALADTTPGSTIYYTTDGTTPTLSSTQYTTPITVSISTTLQAVAVASGFSTSATANGAFVISGPPVTVSAVLSTHDQTKLMVPQTPFSFALNAATTNQVLVDETQTYQSIEGFGASFTDSAAYLLEDVAQSSMLSGTLNDLFTRTGGGIGLSFMRIPIGASDLARSVYSFDDLPAGQTDPTLKTFSIAHDESYVLPLIISAKSLNPQMKLMANPWSPPAWMKSNGLPEAGTLMPSMYTPFANYFVKYIQAYTAAGVPIDYISLQNEPLNITTSYPSMGMDSPTQLVVLRDYLLPALTSNNVSTRVFVYDHNWDTPSYPENVLGDPTILSSTLVAGTAWHGYAGTPGAQQSVQNEFPTKGMWETEHSGGTFTVDQFTTDFLEITQVLRNSSKSFVKWSLALDENLGPNLTDIGLGGCNTCTPIVTVNSKTGAVTKDIEFYTLGHYSKYVLPGAERVYSSNASTIASVAFVNPDRSKVLVAFNNSVASQTFQVQWGVQSFSYALPSFAVATFTWSGNQTGSANLSATSVIQASSYSSIQGLQTETVTDETGEYDLGYVTNGAYAIYKNVSFGAAVTKVNVRTASGGNGGSLEFHLDSATGTLLGTATLPVTGGYQNWQTVTAPITGASGIHDLYLVFHGTGGIANLNWFQFE
jgi:glucosylceramidase